MNEWMNEWIWETIRDKILTWVDIPFILLATSVINTVVTWLKQTFNHSGKWEEGGEAKKTINVLSLNHVNVHVHVYYLGIQ